ncbi:WecB/TagA/CpsF family glycosyltransferase [Devosia sp. A449]
MLSAFDGKTKIDENLIQKYIKRTYFIGAPFDDVDFDTTVEYIVEQRGVGGFKYVVTPNVDHVVRNAARPALKIYYENAWLTVCDSKPLALLGRLLGHKLPRVTGSDLTIALFERVIRDGDRLTLIAPHQAVIDQLRQQYPRLHIRAYVPPFGVGENPVELQRCVDFAVQEPADFVFIAIGAPQSEAIAYAMSLDGRATGVCFCIGAALEFVTGLKPRAPQLMSTLGLEWLHRLLSDPRRLWRRYVFAVVPLLGLVAGELRQKRKG